MNNLYCVLFCVSFVFNSKGWHESVSGQFMELSLTVPDRESVALIMYIHTRYVRFENIWLCIEQLF